MPKYPRLFQKLKSINPFHRREDQESSASYNLWSSSYDHQEGNLMMDMDEDLINRLFHDRNLEGQDLADIGCGTGRHWKKFLSLNPARLVGFDESEGMLKVLKSKYPDPLSVQIQEDEFPSHFYHQFDILVSTLTLAHIKELKKALGSWSKLLRDRGEIIITDYHPALLESGGRRTFSFNKNTISIKNYIHPLESIIQEMKRLGFTLLKKEEQYIDESVKSYYQNKGALPLFEKFKGTPLIYGLHFFRGDSQETIPLKKA